MVTDLVTGAGLKFSERGSRELKGLPGRWGPVRRKHLNVVFKRRRVFQ